MNVSKRTIQKSIDSILKRVLSPATLEAVGIIELLDIEKSNIEFDIKEAFDDTNHLDESLAEGNYTTSLIEALNKEGSTIPVLIHCLARKDMKSFKAQAEASFGNDYQLYKREWHLYRMRELLRDQNPLENVLKIYSKTIEEFASIGDTVFFKKMSDMISKHKANPNAFSRGYEGWIVRAWLTFSLWEKDALEAYELLAPVAKILSIPLPDVLTFREAFKRVRARKRDRYIYNLSDNE